MDIYKNIYETVNSNLEKNGMHFPFSEEQYLNIVRRDPYNVKISEFKEITSESDMNAFFYRTLNRLCDDNARNNVFDFASCVGLEPRQDLLTAVACEVSSWKELKIKHKRVVWDINSKERQRALAVVRKKHCVSRIKLAKEKIKLCTIIRVWDVFPNKWKNKIRRLFGREEK